MAGGYDLNYMKEFMAAAGYILYENNLTDLLLMYAVIRKMNLAKTYALFETFPNLFNDEKLIGELFGNYLKK
jgi:hypothetical protein